MPIVIETPQEFDIRHTKDGPKVAASNWELFPDGAVRDRNFNHHEPPTEPGELLKAKRRYVALKLHQEEKAFEHFKGDCELMLSRKAKYGNQLPGPAPDAKQQLERGAERIRKLRDELATMDREIANLPDKVASRKFWEQLEANQQAARDQLGEITSISVYHNPHLDRLNEILGTTKENA